MPAARLVSRSSRKALAVRAMTQGCTANGAGANLAGSRNPVENRHLQVHEDNLEFFRLTGLHRLGAVLHQGGLVAQLFQHGGDDAAIDRVVLGHQNAQAGRKGLLRQRLSSRRGYSFHRPAEVKA